MREEEALFDAKDDIWREYWVIQLLRAYQATPQANGAMPFLSIRRVANNESLFFLLKSSPSQSRASAQEILENHFYDKLFDAQIDCSFLSFVSIGSEAVIGFQTLLVTVFPHSAYRDEAQAAVEQLYQCLVNGRSLPLN